MKTWKATLLIAALVFVVSAAVAPWIFAMLHPLLPNVPFRRLFDRVLLVVAALSLWPLFRSNGIRSWRELGYVPEMFRRRQLPLGLALGLASYGLGILCNASSLHCGDNAWKLAGFVLTAIVVALIEETFFRGGLQNILQRQTNMCVALLVVSAVYSVVHFLKPSAANIADDAVCWRSGFDYIARVASRSLREPSEWRGAVTLWLAGIALGWAFVRTRSLGLSIGLHAGWVFALKTAAWLGAGSFVDNMLLWPVLILLIAGIEWLSRRNK
jgi:membrane protease YdiL (CAAX protease family)